MKYLLMLSLFGCGNSINIPKKIKVDQEVKVKTPDKIEVDPVEVQIPETQQIVIHQIDIAADSTLFQEECELEFTIPEEIEVCKKAKLTELLQTIIDHENDQSTL